MAHDPPNRFESVHVDREGWRDPDDPARRTQLLKDATRTIIAHNDSPDVGFDVSVNPYRGCEHGCVYCLGPATPVLQSDMSWRPIGDVSVGDTLVGFDEYPESGRTRKLRQAVVERLWWSRKPTLRLITERSEIVTTDEHLWLQWHNFRWSRTEQLSPGRQLRWMPPTPLLEDTEDYRRGYIAGMTLGDGTYRFEPGGGVAVAPQAQSVFGRQPGWQPEPILAIEPGPVQDVVDIQTSTGTFVANGLATHNCYARPNHEYLGFSPGLDFETKILVKERAPELLRKAMMSRRWKPQPLGMSGVTDPYQPAEKRLRITRGCLEVLAEFRNPVAIVTKNHLVTRDVDLLAELASVEAACVTVSVTTLRNEIQRVMEPRTSVPKRRLRAIEALAKAGVPVAVNVAPVVPGLTDHEMPAILEAAANAGATRAAYIMLKLPYAVKEMFAVWLEQHFPDRAGKVMNRLYSLRGGKLYDGRYGFRQRGEGPFAEQVSAMFDVTTRRLGLNGKNLRGLSNAAFRRPHPEGQGDLFDG